MPTVSATNPTINPEFVARLAERAQDAERQRQRPATTMDDLNASGASPDCSCSRATAAAKPTSRPSSIPSDGWHIVRESRAVIADLLEASGAAATCCSTTTPAANSPARSHWV
jgi:hypothetical protein